MDDIEYRCFVGKLAWCTNEDSLTKAFSPFGDGVEDCETGRSRGFGFVTFANEQSMRDAIERMNGENLDGRNITVNEAQSRRNGGGAYRSGDGDGCGYGQHREGGGGYEGRLEREGGGYGGVRGSHSGRSEGSWRN